MIFDDVISESNSKGIKQRLASPAKCYQVSTEFWKDLRTCIVKIEINNGHAIHAV